jgi:hypothetical protein
MQEGMGTGVFNRLRFKDLANSGPILLLLAAIFWVARYLHSPSFGLYEDDLSRIPSDMSMTGHELLSYLLQNQVRFLGQGRPLHEVFITAFSWLGARLGGLWGMYLVGYAITIINVILFYVLIRRLSGPVLALFCSLAYVLFSADTTQAYLYHSLGVQPALTLFMLAAHSYLSGRKGLTYVLGAGALLCYETVFPLLFALPLLGERWDRTLLRRWMWHAAILAGILIASVLVRAAMGERRVAGLGLADLLTTPITHTLVGPVVSLGTYIYRPYQALRSLNLESGIAMAVGLVSLALLFLHMAHSSGEYAGVSEMLRGARTTRLAGWLVALRKWQPPFPVSDAAMRWVRLLVTGGILLALAYPLTFTIRPYAISGRDTRVHLAAVVGSSVVVGSIAVGLLAMPRGAVQKRVASVVLAAFFSLMLGYGLVVQNDYVLAWKYQRDFWTRAVPLLSDVTDGTAVLVDPAGLRDTLQIGANYWNMPRVLNQIYQFPDAWRLDPQVYRLSPDWRDHILTQDGKLRLDGSTTVAPPSTYQTVNPQNAILLEPTDGGRWLRESTVLIAGRQLILQASGPKGEPPYPHGFLYSLLIERGGGSG